MNYRVFLKKVLVPSYQIISLLVFQTKFTPHRNYHSSIKVLLFDFNLRFIEFFHYRRTSYFLTCLLHNTIVFTAHLKKKNDLHSFRFCRDNASLFIQNLSIINSSVWTYYLADIMELQKSSAGCLTLKFQWIQIFYFPANTVSKISYTHLLHHNCWDLFVHFILIFSWIKSLVPKTLYALNCENHNYPKFIHRFPNAWPR